MVAEQQQKDPVNGRVDDADMETQITGMDPERLQRLEQRQRLLEAAENLEERLKIFREHAEEDAADWLDSRTHFLNLEKGLEHTPQDQEGSRRTLESMRESFGKWGSSSGEFEEEATTALSVIEKAEKNPFMLSKVPAIRSKRQRDLTASLREGAGTSLKEFTRCLVENKEAHYALEGSFTRPDQGNSIKTAVRFHAVGGKLEVEKATHRFLVQSARTPDGRIKSYNLEVKGHEGGMPSFKAISGPDLHPVIQNLLTKTWEVETRSETNRIRRDQIMEESTISARQFLDGETGVVAIHHPRWRNNNQVGPITVSVKRLKTGWKLQSHFAASCHVPELKVLADAGLISGADSLNNIVGRLIKDAAKRAETQAKTEETEPVAEEVGQV